LRSICRFELLSEVLGDCANRFDSDCFTDWLACHANVVFDSVVVGQVVRSLVFKHAINFHWKVAHGVIVFLKDFLDLSEQEFVLNKFDWVREFNLLDGGFEGLEQLGVDVVAVDDCHVSQHLAELGIHRLISSCKCKL